MTGRIASAFHDNPDGSQVYELMVAAGQRGYFRLQCIVNKGDPLSVGNLRDLGLQLQEQVSGLTNPPRSPKTDPAAITSDPNSDAMNISGSNFENALDRLHRHSKKELDYKKNAPELDQVFDNVIKPYMDSSNVQLQDKVFGDGDHMPAVEIVDYPVVSYDKMTRTQRIQQDMIERTILRTERFYQGGKAYNHNGITLLQTKREQPLFSDFPGKTEIVQAQKIDESGNRVVITPEELSFHRFATFGNNKDQCLTEAAGLDSPDMQTDLKLPMQGYTFKPSEN